MDQWPIEYADQLILGNPDSNVAVCTLWSKKELVAEKLSAEQYCVIGNLYSRAGLNPMLRNLFANPRIRFLVIAGRSLTDSKEALVRFFHRGVDANWQIVGNGGQIDKAFPAQDLIKLRSSVTIIDASEKNLPELIPKVSLDQFAEPKFFLPSSASAEVLPSEHCGIVVRGRDVVEVWTAVLAELHHFGRVVPTDYGAKQKELLNVLTVIQEPQVTMKALPHWAPFDLEAVRGYVHRFFAQSVEEGISYGYGERLQTHWSTNQLLGMISDLKRASFSRRAVATFWDPLVDAHSSDPPCLMTLQLALREERLFVTAYIRSNDMFRAYPLNVASLAYLQNQASAELGVGTGFVSVLSHSAHVYADCWEACAQAASSYVPAAFVQDPRGSFVFSSRNAQLIAEHYSVEGDLIQTFSAANAGALMRLLRPYISRIDHAMYVGKEIDGLQRAQATNSRYIQDEVT
jgi:thymidylate synthase